MACTVVMVLGTLVGGFQSLLTIHFSLIGIFVFSLGWTLFTGVRVESVGGVIGWDRVGRLGGQAGSVWCEGEWDSARSGC